MSEQVKNEDQELKPVGKEGGKEELEWRRTRGRGGQGLVI
jgi:hypothetical protein